MRHGVRLKRARIWDRRPAGTDEQGVLSASMQVRCLSPFSGLQRAGLIRSEWKATENSRRAKYYVLTDQGRKRLNSETGDMGKASGGDRQDFGGIIRETCPYCEILPSGLRSLLRKEQVRHVTLDWNDSGCVILMVRGKRLLFPRTESA